MTNEVTIEKEITGAGVTVPQLLFRIMASLAGGFIGSVVLIFFFIVANTLLSPVLSGTGEVSIGSVFVFMVMVMIFFSTLIGNIISTLLISLTDKNKYKRRSTALTQIAVISIMVVIFMIPIYFITATIDVQMVIYAVVLHMLLTIITSVLTLEIVSNYRYSLLGLYGVSFSIIVSSGVFLVFFKMVPNVSILLFIALPTIWLVIGIVQGLTMMVYASLARIYDKDFLSTQTMYGDDYGKEVGDEIVDEEEEEDLNDSGESFLRN